MKRIIPLMYGLISAAIVAVIATIFLVITGTYFSSYSLFFVMPVGAAILGYYCVNGINIGVIRTDKKPSNYLLAYSVLTSLICFVGIYFIAYLITYVNSDMQINHIFKGQHISNFAFVDTNQPVTFLRYLSFEINSRGSSLIFSFGRTGNAVPYGPIPAVLPFNWLMFMLEGIGFIAGGWLRVKGIEDEKYCNECNKYYKYKKIRSIYTEELEEKIDEILSALNSGIQLKGAINATKRPPFYNRKPHANIEIWYCPSCHTGILYIKYYRPTATGFEEQPSKMQKFELNHDAIKELST